MMLISPNKLVFKDIPPHLVGNVSGYQISNSGRIKKPNGKVSSGLVTTSSSPKVKINYHECYLHRLLGFVFIPNPDNLPQINHLDGNHLNCVVENLVWSTGQDNCLHAHETGLNKTSKAVLQFTNEGVFVREFKSKRSASEVLKISKYFIAQYLKRTKINPLFSLRYK